MGTWGIGTFENDTACDFAGEVADGGGFASLEKALDRVEAVGGGYLEASDAAEALAAADIIARLRGNPGEQTAYTETIDQWVGRQPSPPQELVEKARRCVSRILADPSEIVELWQDTDEFDVWKRAVEAVSARL